MTSPIRIHPFAGLLSGFISDSRYSLVPSPAAGRPHAMARHRLARRIHNAVAINACKNTAKRSRPALRWSLSRPKTARENAFTGNPSAATTDVPPRTNTSQNCYRSHNSADEGRSWRQPVGFDLPSCSFFGCASPNRAGPARPPVGQLVKLRAGWKPALRAGFQPAAGCHPAPHKGTCSRGRRPIVCNRSCAGNLAGHRRRRAFPRLSAGSRR